MSNDSLKRGWYATTFESSRFTGRRNLTMHVFKTESVRDRFVNDYNMVNLDWFDSNVPDVYRMAERSSDFDVMAWRDEVYVGA